MASPASRKKNSVTEDRKSRPKRRMLTVKQIAEADQVSPRTVRRWLESGKLPHHKLDGLIRIGEDDHAVFLAQCRRT
jgi:excisionase family DNA binding protein